jgi:hypothetical protein
MQTQMQTMEGERAKRAVLKKLKTYIGLPLDILLADRDGKDSASTTCPPSCARDAVALFHGAAELVPAYQTFLSNQGVSPSSISTFRCFLLQINAQSRRRGIQKRNTIHDSCDALVITSALGN